MRIEPQWIACEGGAPESGALHHAIDGGALAADITLFNDPRWIASLADADKRLATYVLRAVDRVVGVATFLVHPSAIRVALGDVTLLSRRVRRFNALAPPLVRGEDGEFERVALRSLLRCIRSDLGADDVLFLESVAAGTALFELIGAADRVEDFHVVPNGPLYRHWSATIPADFEAYLAQLGSRTRADLRSTRKRFIARVGRYEVRCFRTPADVAPFVSDAAAVSRTTHQYRLLGAGLRAPDALERCYAATAALGWFRSYVLYADGGPIAFQVGHVHGRTFFAQEIGYDPEWASSHAGIFLHTEVVADLAASGAAATFDFGNGDSLHKQRLATSSRVEGYFYLIPATARGAIVARTMRTTNAASAAIGNALDRVGMRRRTKAWLRRLGVMK